MMAHMTHGGWADADADIIAIDEHSALCLAAHDAGSPLWQALVDGTSLEKLVNVRLDALRRTPDRLAPDIDELFGVFDERGLLNG